MKEYQRNYFNVCDIKKTIIDDTKANKILKDLYESNFFEDVSLNTKIKF